MGEDVLHYAMLIFIGKRYEDSMHRALVGVDEPHVNP
jgi:hypothetical protein